MDKNKTVVGDVLDDVGSRVVGVDILYWGVIPGVLVTLCILYLFFGLIGVDIYKSTKIRICDKITDPNFVRSATNHTPRLLDTNCRYEEQSGYYKLLLIPMAIGFGFIAGRVTFLLGLARSNKKAAAGFGAAYAAKSIWNM